MPTTPQLSEWTTSATSALSLTLVRSARDALEVMEEDPEARVLLPFHPTFTYPIFGDQEMIYGYKGLSIEVSQDEFVTHSYGLRRSLAFNARTLQLNMTSGSLHQYLKISYTEKVDSQADDIEGTLFKFIPPSSSK